MKDISSILTPTGETPKRGKEQGEVLSYEKYSIGIKGDKIVTLMPSYEANTIRARKTLDCRGYTAIPGLVDAHTHIPFLRMRTDEFYERMKGVSYTEIARRGGGILSTVKDVRKASEDELYKAGKMLLRTLASNGVTTAECKTGYGLTREDELKEARVIQRLALDIEIDVVGTFLGAHAVPEDRSKIEYIEEVIDTIKDITKIGVMKFIDIFCDEGAFDVEDLRKVLFAGKINGLIPRAHVNEIRDIGGIKAAVEVGCRSLDHVRILSDEEIEILASSDAVVVLLPMTSFFLNMNEFTPARRLIDEGIPVALASDFNPGSCMLSNPFFAMLLGIMKMGMTAAESLTAYTLNAAYVLGFEAHTGSIEIGKQADIVLLRTSTFEDAIPIFDEDVVVGIIKKGRIEKWESV